MLAFSPLAVIERITVPQAARDLSLYVRALLAKPVILKLGIKEQGGHPCTPLWCPSPAQPNGDMPVRRRARCARTPRCLVFIMVLAAWQRSLRGLPHPSLSGSHWAANTS